MNDSYTIVLTAEQKEVVVAAVAKFSELLLGQTKDQHDCARQLAAKIKRISAQGTNDLTK